MKPIYMWSSRVSRLHPDWVLSHLDTALVSQSDSIQNGTIHTKVLLYTTKAVCLLNHLAMAHANCIRPQKVNYMFLRHRPRHFQPPRIKNFYCIPTDKCEKSSTHRPSELTVQSGRHLPCLWLVGWLNSGASALAIRYHLLKVRIFTEHRRNIVFIHKR